MRFGDIVDGHILKSSDRTYIFLGDDVYNCYLKRWDIGGAIGPKMRNLPVNSDKTVLFIPPQLL